MDFQSLGHAMLFTLGHEPFKRGGGSESGRFGIDGHARFGSQKGAISCGFIDEYLKPGRIEIHVGQGGKDAFAYEPVHGRVGNAFGPGLDGHLGQALQGIDEQILQCGHFGLLAAYADLGAAGASGRLFTLVAKHDFLLGCLFLVENASSGEEDCQL